MSFPRKRESSFFALDHCFPRGDIVGFSFPQQILIRLLRLFGCVREIVRKEKEAGGGMIKAAGMFMIGAAGSGAGKTTLACRLLSRFGPKRDIIGIKVTAIEDAGSGCPRGGQGCGVCASIEDRYCISEETDSGGLKDTCRILAAGASRVLWLRVLKGHLAEGAAALLEIVGSDSVSVCESNSLRRVVEPGAFVLVKDARDEKYKPSAKAVARYAERIIAFDGDGFDIEDDDIRLADGKWTVRMAATAIILAGGDSRRIGKDKGMLPIKGQPIIKHILEQLRPYFTQILISSNDLSRYNFPGVEVVSDRAAGHGPLMGIASALRASASELNFVIACDIPEVDMELVRMMVRQGREFDAVVPVTGPGRYEPVFAVYKKGLLRAMEAALAAGNNRIMEALKHRSVKYVDLTGSGKFGNINTVEDYRQFLETQNNGRV